MAGRPPHEPTRDSRRLVEHHAATGTPHAQIAKLLQVSINTLKKHYPEELELGLARANAVVSGTLFNEAKKGNITACIFWLKTRAHWRETAKVEHSGGTSLEVRQVDATKLSDATLNELMGPAAMRLTGRDWRAIEREFCARSLVNFIRRAWPVVEPGTPYVHGWHIDAIAEHLEAVTAGEISRLLINVPPGCMKSLAVGVLWPAWEWGPRAQPQLRYVGAAHAQDLAVRDNMRMRRLVKSDWYQRLWPLGLAADQDAKLKFENAATGFRAAVAATAMTGHRGDRVLYDDPHSVEGALSDLQRNTVLRVFSETVTTRLNSPERSAIVVVMQRLHEQDLSGTILERELGYVHLCLPMEFEVDRRCTTAIGFRDPRDVEGELLFPERFPAEVVERDKRAMGELGTAGQFQQRPTPRGGGMFPTDRFVVIDHPPEPEAIAASIRYWDKAGTKNGGAHTAGVLLHKLKDGRFCVAHCRRGQWAALEREQEIQKIAEQDGKRIRIGIEQEPGSGGKESAETTIRNLAGWRVTADRPTGDKVVRAEPYAAQVQGGNVLLVRGAWNRDFIDEHVSFPVGRAKDQVDATSAAFNLLTLRRTGLPAVTDIDGLMG